MTSTQGRRMKAKRLLTQIAEGTVPRADDEAFIRTHFNRAIIEAETGGYVQPSGPIEAPPVPRDRAYYGARRQAVAR